MRVLTDDDVRRLDARAATDAMRRALIECASGTWPTPERHSQAYGGRRILFGGAASPLGAIGLRISGPATSALEHCCLVWSPTGSLEAVIVGNELGARRTGACSALSADLCAPPGPVRVGILGSGRNGWTQIWALAALREIRDLAVYSPNPLHRRAFAQRARDELGIDAYEVAEARAAAEGRQVLIFATTSATPVADAAWIDEECHVISIGPKTTSAHEVPEALVRRLGRLLCDAPEELRHPVSEASGHELERLGSALASDAPRTPGTSLYLHAGLGATDAAYALAVLDSIG